MELLSSDEGGMRAALEQDPFKPGTEMGPTGEVTEPPPPEIRA